MRFQRVIPFLCLIGCNGLGKEPVPVEEPLATVVVTPPQGTDTGVAPEPETFSCGDVPDQAREVIEDRCSACHGKGSPGYGSPPFNDATNAVYLVQEGWVVPGDTANSPIFTRINANEMPTAEGGGPLVDTEKAIIQAWVECGAIDWGSAGDSARGFVPPEAEFEAALLDVLRLEDDAAFGDERRNARYLSLVSLYNAGVPSERIELYKTALHKLMWSLTEENAPLLVPIDLEGVPLDDGTESLRIADNLGKSLLFRVDQNDFAWDNAGDQFDRWEEMVKLYPFAISYLDEFDAAEELAQFTETRIPIVQGDWFAANASLPPLYFDLLDIPDNFDEFLLQFGNIDSLDAEFDGINDDVQVAGMDGNQTLVSNFNRVIARIEQGNYCWTSFDFGGVANQQNIFAFPTDFIANSDGGEAFCQLDNGQQAYFVFNAARQRLDNAPINVVSDYNPDSGGEVKTGLHCMRCHEVGIIERLDQILDTVLSNQSNFDDDVVELVEEWYPPNSQWTAIYERDISDFQSSLTQLGVPVGEEVTWALSEDYEAGLTSARVAATLGIPEGELSGRLASNGAVEINFQSLDTPGGLVSRDLFESVAVQTICDLQLGDVCPDDVAILAQGQLGEFCGAFINGAFGGSSVPCPDGSVCDQNLGQCTKITAD